MAFTKAHNNLFNPAWDTNGYNARDALSLAVLSNLAYEPAATATKVLKQNFGFHAVVPFDKQLGKDIDTQGFIAAHKKNLVVAFRGSEGKAADWLANVQTVVDPGPFPKSKVHEGFQDALFPAVLTLGYTLRHLGTGGMNIWITGHSLGGALASLFTAMLLEEMSTVGKAFKLKKEHRLCGLYSFASPRVGNRDFDTAFGQRASKQKILAYRVVNDGDAVPHVPPEPWFSHAGTRVLLKGGKALRPDATKKEKKKSDSGWKNMRREMAEFFMEDINPFHIADVHRLHGKKGYIEALKQSAK